MSAETENTTKEEAEEETFIPPQDQPEPGTSSEAQETDVTSKLRHYANLLTRRGSRFLFPTVGTDTADGGGNQPPNPKLEAFRKAVRNVQMRKRMASFFGVDEGTEEQEKKLWDGRRQRFASRAYGELKPEWRPSMSDTGEEGNREKASVAKLTFSGVTQLVSTLKKRQGSSLSQAPTTTPKRPQSVEVPQPAVIEFSFQEPAVVTNRSYFSFPSVTSALDDDVFADTAPASGEAPTERAPMTRWQKLRKSTISTSYQTKRTKALLGKCFGCSEVKSKALARVEVIDDSRPFFTYWVTTVQILILIISVASYGFGPVGFSTLDSRTGLVLTSSLSLQQVTYEQPCNLYWGPRSADLIHLGAKFAPCMRSDAKIGEEIELGRSKERNSACCIRNDESGCVQSTHEECSDVLSKWKKWTGNGTTERTSGSVCGLDPNYCEAPASVGAYQWPDDITNWPICTKTSVIPHDKFGAEHMTCEIIGRPCCIGIHGTCQITTKEYCDFMRGHFHEEAFLCSQVSCLKDVCGMIPFFNPDVPDQFYRLITSLFLHAGFAHLFVTVFVQWYLMRDLEKLTGTFRIMIIYFGAGIGGNLASAVFLPYRADVGPTGSQFGLLASFIVEVLNMWKILKTPYFALSKLLLITLGLFLIGLLPWVDNFSHIFGLLFGFLLSYALLPFSSIGGEYDRRKKIRGIWICLISAALLYIVLFCLFYVFPVYDCPLCDIFNCIPLWPDFCANQNINFKRTKSLL